MKKLLMIGSGGREHAIARKLLESPTVTTVYCAPGNPGMTRDGIELVSISETDHTSLIQFAKGQEIAWTFVGPEVPLLNGLVDDFEAAGLKAFGPRKDAALIEGSKDFAKQLMNNYQIPTAAHETFHDFKAAKAYVEAQGAPIVIKADGLAAGKGVVVAETVAEAVAALSDMLEANRFGASGARVVVEEFLAGEEFSLLAFVDQERVYPMIIAQDHKRAFDQDRGPNTGGMGAYAPVPQIPQEMVTTAIETILKPAAAGLVSEGRPFTGILYAGLIATETGPKVIEFNARFGDPETQVVLPRLTSDFAAIIDALLTGKEPEITWQTAGVTLGVVVAADGYPGEYAKGQTLPDFSGLKDLTVTYAGVAEKNGQLVTNGGRVYLIEGSASTVAEAQHKIYSYLETLDTTGTFYRKDIGSKAIQV
ncbi:phosphoribosylamine-glycine ligase [Enterococcus canis]|uniref:Phosphoribosylamine--glycine ligase n=1 Tax=Enterococcus canis TaxID=214095 RepID=A0A1L8RJD1_9ENTE|nr:phosphoribosylamine--glycine ligase [Enterococcus canis]OJG19867.1 phosphoribosylamine-glycine ligase [Enterococcus canis]